MNNCNNCMSHKENGGCDNPAVCVDNTQWMSACNICNSRGLYQKCDIWYKCDHFERLPKAVPRVQSEERTVDGLKYDADKPDMTFLQDFGDALAEICKLCAVGAAKYERSGWTKINESNRFNAAMLRHYFKMSTELVDNDSGVMHDVAVAWNALAALQTRIRNMKTGTISI